MNNFLEHILSAGPWVVCVIFMKAKKPRFSFEDNLSCFNQKMVTKKRFKAYKKGNVEHRSYE